MYRSRDVIVLAAATALVLGLAAAAGPAAARDASEWPPPLAHTLKVAITQTDNLVVRRSERLPPDNPYAQQWRDVPYVEVAVLPQQVTMPRLQQPSVSRVRLQALHDGQHISWRVSWSDHSPDGNVDVSRFSDGVAIGFPIDPNASPMMGHADGRVQILYWKALWQKDIDAGFQDVQELHPNYWSDLYWFAEGEFPFPVPEAFSNPESLQWFIAHQAGNPVAAFSRSQPVEELVAEGWGTLTHQPQSATAGKGAWVRDTWAVVFTRPLSTDDPLDYAIEPGKSGQIVLAVWQGHDGNVGGRKHWSNWTPFEVQP